MAVALAVRPELTMAEEATPHQAVSRDGGKTWEPNWFMDWVRA